MHTQTPIQPSPLAVRLAKRKKAEAFLEELCHLNKTLKMMEHEHALLGDPAIARGVSALRQIKRDLLMRHNASAQPTHSTATPINIYIH